MVKEAKILSDTGVLWWTEEERGLEDTGFSLRKVEADGEPCKGEFLTSLTLSLSLLVLYCANIEVMEGGGAEKSSKSLGRRLKLSSNKYDCSE